MDGFSETDSIKLTKALINPVVKGAGNDIILADDRYDNREPTSRPEMQEDDSPLLNPKWLSGVQFLDGDIDQERSSDIDPRELPPTRSKINDYRETTQRIVSQGRVEQERSRMEEPMEGRREMKQSSDMGLSRGNYGKDPGSPSRQHEPRDEPRRQYEPHDKPRRLAYSNTEKAQEVVENDIFFREKYNAGYYENDSGDRTRQMGEDRTRQMGEDRTRQMGEDRTRQMGERAEPHYSGNNERSRRPNVEPSEADLLRAKHTMIIQLHSLESQGVTLTKNYTMYDDLDEIHFELLRQQNNVDCTTTVDQWMVYIIILFFLIEWINTKLGSPLYFHKVGEYSIEKIGSLRVPLQRCYHRYVHSSATNPIMDVCKAIAAILFGYHLKTMLGISNDETPQRAAEPTTATPSASSLFSLLPMVMKTFGGFGGTAKSTASSSSAEGVKHRPFSVAGDRTEIKMPPAFSVA
jgi:hypothetical protein